MNCLSIKVRFYGTDRMYFGTRMFVVPMPPFIPGTMIINNLALTNLRPDMVQMTWDREGKGSAVLSCDYTRVSLNSWDEIRNDNRWLEDL